jgi:hypothetical protein
MVESPEKEPILSSVSHPVDDFGDWEVLARSRNGSVGIAMGYGLDRRSSIPGRGKIFFSIPQRPEWLWGPPGLLSNGHRGSFYGNKAAGA